MKTIRPLSANYCQLIASILALWLAAASQGEAAFKKIIGGINVAYSGDGADAFFDDNDGTLTIEITQGGGSLNVTVGPTAVNTWGSFVDIYLAADFASLKSINIKAPPSCTPFVAGQVNFCQKFSMTGGVIGNTLFYSPDIGLGMVSTAVPPSIALKYSYTTAQLFGYAYPLPSQVQPTAKGLPPFTPDPAKGQPKESIVAAKKRLIARLQKLPE